MPVNHGNGTRSAPKIRIKRVYEPPSPQDGTRVLIDRLWPRGVSKVRARVDEWRRDLAPSEELRKWYGHKPARFARFRARYRGELLQHTEAIAELIVKAEVGTLTLVFAVRDTDRCNASVLKELLEENLS
jgi:uncharacterized protein YeaO (DUF488 family)